MNLHYLCSAPHLTVYFDSDNQWLYTEWDGALTLPIVQQACLEVARCFLENSYPRVLNSNAQVTHVDPDVTTWLVHDFFPYLGLAGIRQLAWVHAPGLRGHNMAQQTVNELPHLSIALFSHMEEAVTWLQHYAPASATAAPRSAGTEQAFAKALHNMATQVSGHPPLGAGS